VSKAAADEYIVTLRYEESGYIKDEEELDGRELLESIQEGEEAYNEERKKLGFTPIHAAGLGRRTALRHALARAHLGSAHRGFRWRLHQLQHAHFGTKGLSFAESDD
jgi:hypothetical protein